MPVLPGSTMLRSRVPDHHPQTALSFFRKKQTIQCLERERPQSLKSFYSAVLAAVGEIERQVQTKLDCFYGGHRTCQEKIKEYLFDVTMVVTKLVLPCIYSTKQVEGIVHVAQDPNAMHQLDLVHVDNMKIAIKKIVTSVNADFTDVYVDLNIIVAYVTKYCVTFCDSRNAESLNNETIGSYQQQIERSIKTLESNATRVSLLVNKFETSGLYLEDLSSDMRDLARECGCTHSVYLLLYDIACRDLRQSCDVVREWVKADATYLKDIKMDISDLELETTTKEKELRSLQEMVFQLDFKAKSAMKELLDLLDESDKLQTKECAIIKLEQSLQETKRQLQMDLELKVMRRALLQENAKAMTSRDYAEKSDRLTDETIFVKDQLSTTNRKLQEIKSKTKWLKSRHKLRLAKKANLDESKLKLKTAKRNMNKIESNLNKQKSCLRKMNYVYVQKTSTDTLRKIFHNMPLRSHEHYITPHIHVDDQDDVDRAIKIVSFMIGNDWMKFYCTLPFFPYRGQETITADLAEIVQANMRSNNQVKAKHTLLKWRRLHTRASVTDLKKSLEKIKRDDVVALMENYGGKSGDQRGKYFSNHEHVRLPKLAVMIDDEGNSMLQIQ